MFEKLHLSNFIGTECTVLTNQAAQRLSRLLADLIAVEEAIRSNSILVRLISRTFRGRTYSMSASLLMPPTAFTCELSNHFRTIHRDLRQDWFPGIECAVLESMLLLILLVMYNITNILELYPQSFRSFAVQRAILASTS